MYGRFFWSKKLKSNQQNEKRYWANDTSKPHSARKLRVISYIDPEDSEFGEILKNAHKFLEMTMVSAKPCKIFKQHGQTRCTQHNSRTSRFACTVDVHKSTRTRIGATQPRDHEDLFAEKAFNLLCYCTLVHALIPILQAMKKIPDATAAVDKKWKKPEKLLAWQVTKVFGRKRGHPQGTKRGRDHSFWYVHGLVPPQDGAGVPEIQKVVCYSGVCYLGQLLLRPTLIAT